jgi:Fur family ferric uptake transcriptional regulator
MSSFTMRPGVDEILEQVRQSGARITTARRLVVSTLLDAVTHVTAEDLAATIQDEHPEVHLSTVYRTLESLEKLGVVEHTHVGHGASVYHVGVAHQHLVCEQCGVVIDVPITLLDDLRSTLLERYGFELHAGHSALLGHCRDHAEYPDHPNRPELGISNPD